MKTKLFAFIALALITVGANAQSSSTDFFFDYKKSTLTNEQTATLQILCAEHQDDGSRVKIIGYCDSVGGSDYNVKLGQARVDLFVKFFASNKIASDRITEVNNGSTNPIASNDTEEGRSQNRRVVIKFYDGDEEPAESVSDEISDSTAAVEEEIAVEACSTDTMINLTGGAMLKMNTCEFAKYNSCFSVKIITSAEKLRNSEYTTMGMSGQVMSTAGIVEVKLCEGRDLEHNLTVYVPVIIDCKPQEHPDLWTNFGKGVWNNRTAKAEIETYNGKEFFVYSTKTSNEANFASKIEVKPEFTIKAKKGLKLKQVTVYYSCEMGVYRTTLDEPSKKIKITLPCPSEAVSIDVIAEDKEGNEVLLTNLSTADIKSKGKQKTCEAEGVKKCFYVYPDE